MKVTLPHPASEDFRKLNHVATQNTVCEGKLPTDRYLDITLL